MNLISYIRSKCAHLPYTVITIIAAVSAFGAYTSMYAFRKAFASGTFSSQQYFHVDYKVWLVIAQVLGYTLSKFYGIRFIAEVDHTKRGRYILTLVGISWLALLAFALIPAPYNIVCMLVNGFPLGMIWGLVFGYVEGRRTTEFMAAVMSISLIFASGFIKTTGRTLLNIYHVNEYWMPFLTGLLFVLPLLFFVFFLEVLPPPDEEDKKLRVERKTMSAEDRKKFLHTFLPGIVLTLVIYVLLTITRDVRDNFEVEIWADLGIKNNAIYTQIDSIISVLVLIMIGLLILIRNNMKAFAVIHVMIISGCLLIGLATVAFGLHLISAIPWMTCVGLGLYMGYIPYNAIFFERLIASFRQKGNVGFLMYVADSAGYLGSISVLLFKELGKSDISWGVFFRDGVVIVSFIGGVSAVFSLLYFMQKGRVVNNPQTILSYEQ